MPTHTPAPVNAPMVSIGPNDLYRVTSSVFSSTAFGANVSQSALVSSLGYTSLTVTASLTDNATGLPISGSLVVQRYADLAGTIVQGASQTIVLGANPPNVLNFLSDGNAFQSVKITIQNLSQAATLSQFELLLHSDDAPANITLNTTGAVAQIVAALPGKDATGKAMNVADVAATIDQRSMGEALNMLLIEARIHTELLRDITGVGRYTDADIAQLREDLTTLSTN